MNEDLTGPLNSHICFHKREGILVVGLDNNFLAELVEKIVVEEERQIGISEASS